MEVCRIMCVGVSDFDMWYVHSDYCMGCVLVSLCKHKIIEHSNQALADNQKST